jgi:transglutaminase-like putative cysteine protease
MNTDEVYSQGMSINHSVYTADYTRLAFAPDDLRKAGPISPTDTGARALTAVPYSDYVASVVSGLISGKGNEYDRVLALYDYFSSDNGFRYSLVTTEGNSGSAIVDFLENKKGFCVQYAAALAWLVRQAGYPARVAFGYTRGTQVQDGVYSMSSQNLHAWTEVYFPDFGWVPFDATPGTSVPGSTRTIWAPDVEKTGQGQNTSAPPVQATGAPQTVDPGAGGNTNSGGSDNGGLSISINPWYVVAGALVLLLLVLLAAPSVQRRVRRRRRLASSGGLIALTPPPPGSEYLVTDPDAMTAVQRDAHNAWAELLDTMIDYGVLVDPAETPRGTVGRLAATPQLSISGRAPTAVLGRAEERARYAPSPIRVVNLDDAVREARRAFAEDASRWQQFTAWLFPRSVLLHWRLSWYGFLARSVRRVARTRDALLLVEFRERRRGN